MIKKHGNPITASRPQMKPSPNVLTNANTSSSDAQRMIRRPPAPFASPNNAKNVPAQSNRSQIAGLPARGGLNPNQKAGGYSAISYSIHSGTSLTADQRAAIGESAPSGKGVTSVNSGFPTSGNTRQSGPAGARTTRRRS